MYLPREDLERFNGQLESRSHSKHSEGPSAQRGLALVPLLDCRSTATVFAMAGKYWALLERITAEPRPCEITPTPAMARARARPLAGGSFVKANVVAVGSRDWQRRSSRRRRGRGDVARGPGTARRDILFERNGPGSTIASTSPALLHRVPAFAPHRFRSSSPRNSAARTGAAEGKRLPSRGCSWRQAILRRHSPLCNRLVARARPHRAALALRRLNLTILRRCREFRPRRAGRTGRQRTRSPLWNLMRCRRSTYRPTRRRRSKRCFCTGLLTRRMQGHWQPARRSRSFTPTPPGSD